MTTITAFIKRHPVPAYFALAFLISWGGVVMVVGPGGFPGTREQTETMFLFVYLAMLVGPSAAGILLTCLVHGKAGLREFLSRLLRWQVGARWYMVALLTAPLLVAATLLALSQISPVFFPGIFTTGDKASRLLFGVAVGLGAGIFEELGWTGFAVPEMRLRCSVLITGLIVGVLWGAWHFLVNIWASGNSAGALSLSLFLPAILFDLLVGVLPAYRVLMVWVYERAGSLLVGMLMHASLTTSLMILGPLAISGLHLFTYDFALAAALWIIVAAVVMVNRRQFSQQPDLRASGGSI